MLAGTGLSRSNATPRESPCLPGQVTDDPINPLKLCAKHSDGLEVLDTYLPYFALTFSPKTGSQWSEIHGWAKGNAREISFGVGFLSGTSGWGDTRQACFHPLC
jgi:hypothetical protein